MNNVNAGKVVLLVRAGGTDEGGVECDGGWRVEKPASDSEALKHHLSVLSSSSWRDGWGQVVRPSWKVEAEHEQSCICRSHLRLLIKLHYCLDLGCSLQESHCAAISH